MTECERLIKEGLFNESFFKEENRCEYIVSKEMKKVWAVELDLFLKFGEICKKYDLTYWLAFGSLLGAVRHKGFIPWDDDMDVWMPRKDYNKLLSIPDLKIEKPYFLQTTYNDVDYYNEFARFRNSNTTGVLVSKNNKCNNGIYIDIIPIDGLFESALKEKCRNRWIKIQNVAAHAYAFNVNPSFITRSISAFLRVPLFGYNIQKAFYRLDRFAQTVKWEDAKHVGVTVYEPYPMYRNKFNKQDFGDTVFLEYEGFSLPAPIGYENILKVIYNDYMAFPPIDKRGLWHHFVFNPDVPYNDYNKV